MNKKNNLINLKSDPIVLFSQWFEEAKITEINDANAMNLATISKDLSISSRMVLLKSFDEKGFVFFSNAESKKGVSIKENPKVALNFHWKSLLKQVRIEGKVEKIKETEADQYYNSRPKGSRIGAWASEQSRLLDKRSDLENRVKKYEKKFSDTNIPRPPYWNGFRVKPILIEFWQDMPFRLHDRVEFIKRKKYWVSRNLYP